MTRRSQRLPEGTDRKGARAHIPNAPEMSLKEGNEDYSAAGGSSDIGRPHSGFNGS